MQNISNPSMASVSTVLALMQASPAQTVMQEGRVAAFFVMELEPLRCTRGKKRALSLILVLLMR